MGGEQQGVQHRDELRVTLGGRAQPVQVDLAVQPGGEHHRDDHHPAGVHVRPGRPPGKGVGRPALRRPHRYAHCALSRVIIGGDRWRCAAAARAGVELRQQFVHAMWRAGLLAARWEQSRRPSRDGGGDLHPAAAFLAVDDGLPVARLRGGHARRSRMPLAATLPRIPSLSAVLELVSLGMPLPSGPDDSERRQSARALAPTWRKV